MFSSPFVIAASLTPSTLSCPAAADKVDENGWSSLIPIVSDARRWVAVKLGASFPVPTESGVRRWVMAFSSNFSEKPSLLGPRFHLHSPGGFVQTTPPQLTPWKQRHSLVKLQQFFLFVQYNRKLNFPTAGAYPPNITSDSVLPTYQTVKQAPRSRSLLPLSGPKMLLLREGS